jgi:hypothetical protein
MYLRKVGTKGAEFKASQSKTTHYDEETGHDRKEQKTDIS